MTRARCCSTSRPRSRSAVTAWPMSPRSAPSRRCSARSPRTRRCRGCSRPWPPTSMTRWPRSGRSGPRPGPRCGRGVDRWPARPGDRDGGQVIVDIDATLVTAHSDKEGAEPTFKRGFGFAPMCAFVDHGEHGTGETARDRPAAREGLAVEQRRPPRDPRRRAGPAPRGRARPGAGPRRHRRLLEGVLAPHHRRSGWSTRSGSRPTTRVKAAIEAIPEQAWRAAVDGDGEPRDGAQVAELTAWMPTPITQNRAPRPGPQDWPDRDAGHRPPRTPPPRRTAAADRPQRMADHLLRHQHQGPGLDPGRPRGPAPPTRPLRGPHPQPERHRAAEPALPRLRPEPDLGRGRRTRRRPAHLDPDPRLRRARTRPPLGTQTTPVPDPRRRRTHHPHRPPKTPPTPHETGPGTTSSTPAGPHSAPPDRKPPTPATRTGEPADTAPGNTHAAPQPQPAARQRPLISPNHETSRLC